MKIVKKIFFAGMLFLFLLTPWPGDRVYSQVFFSSPETWQARIQLEFGPGALVREPELDQKLRQALLQQAGRQGAAYHLAGQETPARGRSYVLSLEGSGGLDQLKKMLRLAADPTVLPGDGPLALELTGNIRSGEVLPLALASNPSTGFIWEITALDDQKIRRREGQALRAKSPLLGAPMTQTIVLEGWGDGETTVQITYRRPWLADQPAERKTTILLPDLSLAVAPEEPAPAPQLPVAAADPVAGVEPDQPLLLLDATFDWRNQSGQNYLPPVRNQGSCGSCWAFGTVAPLEAVLKIRQGLSVDLSEQYLVSCSFNEAYDYGCGGGWFAHQYHQWKVPPGEPLSGAVKEADYPYTGTDSACTPPHTHPQKITNWRYVNPSNPYSIPSESAVKNAIATYGPLAAAVCAGPAMAAYRGGIFATDEGRTACNGSVNHAIALVGWNDSEGTWIMRNSWGASWGEGGYMRIKRNVSNIGYAANYVTYDPPPPSQFTASHWVYLPLVTQFYFNGDFEAGPTVNWSQYSEKNWELIMNLGDYSSLGLYNHQGRYAAWLGGDYSETSIISQQMTIPSTAGRLGYWYWIDSVDSCGYDFAHVEFAGTLLKSYNLCYLQDTGGWAYESVDITPYRGRTGVLSFKATIDPDPDFISNLFLDDITFSSGTTQPSFSRGTVAAPAPSLSPSGGARRKTDRGRP
ncbi:MAG: protease inhibitor I42 family protein [Desulfobacterota bacterium]|nr:protease inhibitor I42 family protein [Thermodesulfobacteriota bacterium]